MRIDGNTAPVIGHSEEAVGVELDFDEGGMAGDGLVHRIVDDLGEQMVERLLVGAADIHARAPAHRLQAFQHLDVRRAVIVAGILRRRRAALRLPDNRVDTFRGRWLVLQGAEKVVIVVHSELPLSSLRITADSGIFQVTARARFPFRSASDTRSSSGHAFEDAFGLGGSYCRGVEVRAEAQPASILHDPDSQMGEGPDRR